MEYNLLCEMKQNLDEQISNKKFVDKKLILFGYNQASEEAARYLTQFSLDIDAVIDNNKKKIGQAIGNAMVYAPEDYLLPYKKDVVILIASKYYSEMVNQLENMGYSEEQHIIKMIEYSPYSINSIKKEVFDEKIKHVVRGKEIYSDILIQAKGLEKVFVIPLVQLGDAYLGLSFLRAYLQKNQIHNYVIIMLKSACSKIAILYGVEEKTQLINSDDMSDLLEYLRFTNFDNKKAFIIHHLIPYTVGIKRLGNYRGLTFADQFRYNMYELDMGVKPELPLYTYHTKESERYVEQLFIDNNLIKGKTAILMPYAKTSIEMSEYFWIEIARKLNEKGYKVCTNCGGEGEQVIPGTQKLFFDIKYALETVETAGLVIGLRSGLCDVIASAKCRKIILYPDRYYCSDKYIKFYSLNKMELCNDAIELVYNEQIENDKMVSQVVENLE
ncbi:glycosyltransferase family 9 protein [Anaerosporobacter faecicola]|uniref:glycosyltransferase family 9 protein n=1 Tax=Anaerosporobacter faecicola TaxID=2718714 RepID=UPI00143BA9E4|nr:hypothetical protein [Anaerosporobacter faecicola]